MIRDRGGLNPNPLDLFPGYLLVAVVTDAGGAYGGLPSKRVALSLRTALVEVCTCLLVRKEDIR